MTQNEYIHKQARDFFSQGYPDDINLNDFMRKTKIPYGDAQRILDEFGYKEISRSSWIKIPSATQ